MEINNFTIFGERNSGTTYLENTLKNMLYLNFTKEYGFKHWYIKDVNPRGINNTTTDNECIKSINDSDDTLFIVIVRNVYDWVGAMYNKPHHIKNINKTSILKFISNKYIAFEKSCPIEHEGNTESPWYENENHQYFIEGAENIIELRNLKNNHFYNLQNRVKNYFIIRQENLHDDIKEMVVKFNLKCKLFNLPNYRHPKVYKLDKKTIDFINKNLNNHIDCTLYQKIILD